MSFADSIKKTGDLTVDPNLNIVTYGPPGIGKTHLGSTLPGKTFCIAIEPGIQSLSHVDIPYGEATSVKEIRESFKYVKAHEDDIDSLMIDSMTELAERILIEHQENFDDGRRAYGEMQTQVKKLVKNFLQLDMTVMFTAKQQREETQNGLLYVPSLPGKSLTQKSEIGHDPDYVFAMHIKKDSDGKMHRVFLTEPDGKYRAKKRDPYSVLNKYEKPNIKEIRDKLIESYNQGDDQ